MPSCPFISPFMALPTTSAYAKPVNVLDFHEIVNDVIYGVPIVVAYCSSCFNGVVFTREPDGAGADLRQHQRHLHVRHDNLRPRNRLLVVPDRR